MQTIGSSSAEVYDVVTKVEERGRSFLVTTTRKRQGTKAEVDLVFEVSTRGVSRVSFGGRKDTAPITLQKLPAKVGETWEGEPDAPAGARQYKATYTVRAVEEVEVPAGQFKAVRIEQDLRTEKPVTLTTWHAPGIGVVKSVRAAGEDKTTVVLKSFTPGK